MTLAILINVLLVLQACAPRSENLEGTEAKESPVSWVIQEDFSLEQKSLLRQENLSKVTTSDRAMLTLLGLSEFLEKTPVTLYVKPKGSFSLVGSRSASLPRTRRGSVVDASEISTSIPPTSLKPGGSALRSAGAVAKDDGEGLVVAASSVDGKVGVPSRSVYARLPRVPSKPAVNEVGFAINTFALSPAAAGKVPLAFLKKLRDIRTPVDREFHEFIEAQTSEPVLVDRYQRIANKFYELQDPFQNKEKNDIEGKYLRATDLTHPTDVGGLALDIFNKRSFAAGKGSLAANQRAIKILKIAAFFHDVERYPAAIRTEKVEGDLDTSFRKKVAHPYKSAQIFLDVTARAGGLEPDEIEDIATLILWHDAGAKGVTYKGEVLLPPIRQFAPHLEMELKILAEADAMAFWTSSVVPFANDYGVKPKDLPGRLGLSWDKIPKDQHPALLKSLRAELGPPEIGSVWDPRKQIVWVNLLAALKDPARESQLEDSVRAVLPSFLPSHGVAAGPGSG